MWGTFLSEPLSIAGQVGRYPACFLMERIPSPIRSPLPMEKCSAMGPSGVNLPFRRLFPGWGQVGYALLTRAPVATSGIAAAVMPLDLHVLSL